MDDAFRACCPQDPAGDVILQKDDLRRFSINVDRLVVRIAASGDFGGAVARIADGVWLLGDTPSGHAVVLSFTADNLVAPGAVMAIRAIFTMISILRSFLLRRVFEAVRVGGQFRD